ncbi:MAG: heavy-metal-associated domain-containing protein [Waddliaceae bacterium]
MKVKRIILAVVISAGILAVLVTGFNSSASKGVTNTQEVTLKIEGMTCRVCPLTIKTALKKLDGVVDANVSYEDKVAKVRYEGDKVTVNQMLKAIEGAGKYKATPTEK